MSYDSTQDTLAHIRNVQHRIGAMIAVLLDRCYLHDASKLESPEKEVYDECGPLLRMTEYGSDEYKEILKKMKVGIDHHYSVSPHHPEYYRDGVNGMNLIDLMEMIADWKAASMRHTNKPTDIIKSIEMNAERFGMSEQLKQILLNTVSYMEWL